MRSSKEDKALSRKLGTFVSLIIMGIDQSLFDQQATEAVAQQQERSQWVFPPLNSYCFKKGVGLVDEGALVVSVYDS